MTIELTEEQRTALLRGEPVGVTESGLGGDVVLVRAQLFVKICDTLQDEREQAAFRAFARKQAARLARENPY